jgi:hypothetical protein
MLLLPIVALGPYLVLNVTTYYPRQIVLGYVAMGVSALHVLGKVEDSRARNGPPSSLRARPRLARQRTAARR